MGDRWLSTVGRKERKKVMSGLRSVVNFGREIYRTYIVEMPNNFAASLSYYSLFSLVPTIYIAFLIVGIFIDDKASMQFLFTKVESVLGADVAESLFPVQDPLGKKIKLDDQWFEVIGIMSGKTLFTETIGELAARNLNQDIYLPLSSLMRISLSRCRS